MNSEPTTAAGSHGEYQWLTTDQHDLDALLQSCPQVVLGKFVGITSLDSGALIPTDDEKRAGWRSRNDIAYSPQIRSVNELRHGECDGFDEWYVLESPFDLGQVSKGNVFEAPLQLGQVSVFVNFLWFGLHAPEMRDLTDLFWKQLEQIHPESYIADGSPYLNFVSRDKRVFAEVQKVLKASVSS